MRQCLKWYEMSDWFRLSLDFLFKHTYHVWPVDGQNCRLIPHYWVQYVALELFKTTSCFEKQPSVIYFNLFQPLVWPQQTRLVESQHVHQGGWEIALVCVSRTICTSAFSHHVSIPMLSHCWDACYRANVCSCLRFNTYALLMFDLYLKRRVIFLEHAWHQERLRHWRIPDMLPLQL